MIDISIIVPIFNSEKYLRKCLNSICEQTHENIEIILVNDASPDSSEHICMEYADKDSRIKYYSKDNGGPSSARNFGMLKANGRYIGFCDSDDYIDRNMYKTMLKLADISDSDVVLCDMYSERDRRNFGLPWDDETILDINAIKSELIPKMIGNPSDNDKNLPIWGSCCRAIFRKDIILEKNIKFPEDIKFAEDLVFVIQVLLNSSKTAICNHPFYFYTYNPNSLMLSYSKYQHGIFEKHKKLVSYIRSILIAHSIFDDNKIRLLTTERCYYHECIGNECRSSNGRNFYSYIKGVSQILNDTSVSAAFKSFKCINLKKYIIYSLIKYKLSLPIVIYYRFKLGITKVGK